MPQKLQILKAGLALPLSSRGWGDGMLPGLALPLSSCGWGDGMLPGLALPLSSCGWGDGMLPGSIHVYPGHARAALSTAGPG